MVTIASLTILNRRACGAWSNVSQAAPCARAIPRTAACSAAPKGEMMRNSALCLAKSRAVLTNSLSMITTLALGSSPCLAGGDPAAGKQFFALHCSACHATEPGVNKIGPSLAGVVGRKSGSAPGFNYSPLSRRQTSRGTNRRSISGSRTQWAKSMARGWFSPFLTPQIVRSSLRIWRL
jgi:cytochrome c2